MYTKKKIAFNIQRFANNKLISLGRMRDFLDKSKSIFYMESDCANENEISGIVENQLIPKPVDLSHYAQYNIPDYQNITEIPQENLAYLNSRLIASNMSYMFASCNNLQSVPKLNIDTSQCVNMRGMFDSCKILTSIDLSNFNTSNVTNMNAMFYLCQILTTIDLSNFDTSKVTNMSYMFYNCNSLASLDLSNFNTSNVTNMDSMFGNCHALTSLDLSNFDTSKVTNMSYMFTYCKALTTLDLSNFDTSKVTNMYNMFNGCDSLTTINLSNCDTSNVTSSMSYMFNGCDSLEHIEGIIDMKSCTNYNKMFNLCGNLSGVKIKNPPQAYYGNKTQFESTIGLSSSQYEIVS